MRLCDGHYKELETALRDRGLGAFIAPDGEAFGRRIMAHHREGSTRATFEPFYIAQRVILSASLTLGGIPLLRAAAADSANAEGHQTCPFCFLITNCNCVTKGEPTCGYTRLCIQVADVVLGDAKRLGLVGVS